jgi:hypothetical protein
VAQGLLLLVAVTSLALPSVEAGLLGAMGCQACPLRSRASIGVLSCCSRYTFTACDGRGGEFKRQNSNARAQQTAPAGIRTTGINHVLMPGLCKARGYSQEIFRDSEASVKLIISYIECI